MGRRLVARVATVPGSYLRLGLFAVVTALGVVNALELVGDPAFWRYMEAGLQAVVCVGAIACAVVSAWRLSGPPRTWRLLAAAAICSWLTGQAIWWQHAGGGITEPAPAAAVWHYAFLIFALAALLVLVWDGYGRAQSETPATWSPHSVLVLLVDALVAAASFAVLVWSSELSSRRDAVVPVPGGRPESPAYAALGLVVVVVAAAFGIAYGAGRRHRLSFLLFAGGVVTLITSDRLVAYLSAIGVDDARAWARIGFVVAPLMVAFAVLPLRPGPPGSDFRSGRIMTWSQLLLPYVGALGIGVLMCFHVWAGERVDLVQTLLSVTIVALLVLRQIATVQENRALLGRVLAGQRRLVYQISHDSLTGLPNRMTFAQRLDAALDGGRPFVVIYLDLDDFKDVNDQYGHAAGDGLLQTVAQRLTGCARETDTVARIGGDEFGILVEGGLEGGLEGGSGDGVEPPESYADRYRAALRAPIAVHGQTVRVHASMGLVTLDPDDPPLSSDELLRRADNAMYAGKRQGKDSAVRYRQSAVAGMDFPTALRRARGGAPAGFHVVYQPVVRLPEVAPAAVEALARWTAPNGTVVSPETFVADAEAAGLGAEFDELVLDTVCGEIVAAGITLPFHVNVGAARLGSREFEAAVGEVLARHGVRPEQLVLEITESVPIVDLAAGAAAIRRLQATGVRVALDDFGAGYSSLTYLHALPVDLVKLDRSLTVGIEPHRDAALYRSVIGLCEDLRVDVIVEGIETTSQAATIFAAGARLAQGYRFGRPAPMVDGMRSPRPGTGRHPDGE